MLIRMDAEGHEVEILRGMRNTSLQANAGFSIVIEVHPSAYSSSRSFTDELNFLFDNDFGARFIVSAGQPVPPLYKSLGLSPSDTMVSDGFERGIYSHVPRDAAISLVTALPKCSRYIAPCKN